jgi:hypothetical protein
MTMIKMTMVIMIMKKTELLILILRFLYYCLDC